MKKQISLFLTLSMLTISTMARTIYSDYYKNLPVEVKQVEEFSIPSRTVDIRDFGAKGDGVTLGTEAIQNAIDRLSADGGGHIVFPQGIWLTGPLELKSNIDLHLERNAVIYFSPDKELYVDPNPKAGRVRACISAQRARNISITVEGTIDGNGAQWRPVKRMKVSDV
ncbi:MAG: glycoside hydrolase family 28 protein, partial [Duncaniella sp.]|nr:glycoside hydrolase family 28 protein [Duncaniella sp.]